MLGAEQRAALNRHLFGRVLDLCEKPMANTPADCQQMVDASRQAQRKLMVAYRVRYEPYNQALIKVVRDKEFGPLKVVLSDHGFNIGNPSQWRLKRAMAGGGSLMDIGIYSLNAARYVTGEEPVEINAIDVHDAERSPFRGGRGNDQLPGCASPAACSRIAAPVTAPRSTGFGSSGPTDGPSSIRPPATAACACGRARMRRWKTASTPW